MSKFYSEIRASKHRPCREKRSLHRDRQMGSVYGHWWSVVRSVKQQNMDQTPYLPHLLRPRTCQRICKPQTRIKNWGYHQRQTQSGFEWAREKVELEEETCQLKATETDLPAFLRSRSLGNSKLHLPHLTQINNKKFIFSFPDLKAVSEFLTNPFQNLKWMKKTEQIKK